MVTQIRTLRVSADLDASGYAAGAAQKSAADNAMSASGREAAAGLRAVGDAVVATNTKITSVNDGVERLKRQFVTGYAASVDFERGLKTIGSGLDRGKISAEQASVAVANLSQKYGVAADASHSAAKGNVALGQAITDANARISAQRVAVDDLTASYQRMAAEARSAFAAEQSQSAFNSQLGVGRVAGGSAADSAAFFAAEISRNEEIDRLRSQQNGANFGGDINSRFGIGLGRSGSARDSASVFEEAAREADRYAQRAASLRAQIDPVGAAQAKLNEELAEYSMLAARAEISAKELGQAQALARSRFEAATAGRQGFADNDNNAAFRRQNLTYQAFDVGQGLASGMPLGMIAAQQSGQIAQIYAGQGGLKAALSDVAAMATSAATAIGPIGIALGVTGVAALAYYTLTKRESKSTDDLLKAHQDSIKRVGDLWGDAADQRSKYGRVSTDLVTLGLDNSIGDMTSRLQEDVSSGAVGSGISSAINRNMDATGMNSREFRGSTIFKQLQIDFDALHAATVKGRPDVFGLIQRLQDIRRNSDNTGIRKMAEEAVAALEPFRALAEALREAEAARIRLFNDRGENGRLLSRGTTNSTDASNYDAFLQREKVATSRSQQSQAAQIFGLSARSPQERADAARMAASAQYSDETGPARRLRIEQAGILALAQAEKTLSDARDARGRNLEKILTDQQLEISLIGKTAGEAAGLRREYELINQLKEDARQNGVAVDQSEVDRIKEVTAELSKMTDALARAKVGEDLKFERDQLGRSGIDQQIASRQRGAGLPVDLNSGEADQMREIERAKELREQGRGFVTDLVSGLRNGDKIGETFGNAILNGLSRAADKQLDKLVDSLMSWLFPTAGGAPITSAGTGIVGTILGAANDNKPVGMASVGDVTRSALAPIGAGLPMGFVGNYKSGVDARLTDILNTAAQRTPEFKVDAMSGFRSGDPRFHGKGLATDVQLTDIASGKMLGNYQDAASFRSYEKFAQNARMVQMEKYPELADKFRWGGYFGGGKGKYGAVDSMHFDLAGAGMAGGSWEGGMTSAQKSLWPGAESQGMGRAASELEKLAANAGAATQNLGQFGTGLGGLSQQLMSAANGANSPGFGGIGSLFRGVSPTSSLWAPNTTFGSFLTNGFADGTESAPGGLAMVGERGRELVNLPRGSQVVPNHRTEAILNRAANGNSGSAQPPKIDLHVHVNGGSGDDHIRSLAEQGAQRVLGEYEISQTRGGFGKVNSAFASRRT